jgi:antitoxin (DNA-binding transcriptional repressor) of toxin-antitoxin stability system
MKAITMMDLKQNAAAIIRQIGRGRSFILKYRGKPAVRMSPLPERSARKAGRDPFYALAELAAQNGESMSNEAMDRAIYGA